MPDGKQADHDSSPPFSFLMITYNQEQYIADALNSALAQDYPNLEIIVSDDCSSDQTFAIATDIASNYRGPHKITLNRNEPNLGIGAISTMPTRCLLANGFSWPPVMTYRCPTAAALSPRPYPNTPARWL